MIQKEMHVLIIGGGIVGAALAQALRKHSIPFTIFERDSHVAARDQGWGMTLHWAIPTLYSILPAHVHPLIHEAQVYPSQSGAQVVPMLCLNAATAEVQYRIPPARRIRVKRELLRRAMLEDLPVQWNKRLAFFTVNENGLTASFDDGTTATGTLLVGADGSASTARKLLAPDTHTLTQLPIRGIGFSAVYTPEQMAPMLALDPLLFMATHPETAGFLWWSVLDTPATSGHGGYNVQHVVSWEAHRGDVPATNEERVAVIKSHVQRFAEPLRKTVQSIPDDTETVEIRIADWDLAAWDNHRGRATLAGDAAHAMTMYRGDACNHGIMDAANLADALKRVKDGEMLLQEAVDGYEHELRERCRPAVLASRHACLDAHRFDKIGVGSPLVERSEGSERRMKFEELNGT